MPIACIADLMKRDDPSLKPQYRMPRVFGALPGPRNVPKDKQDLPNNQTNFVLSVSALTDDVALRELLPPACVLDGDPVLTVNLTWMSHIGWLECTHRAPVAHKGLAARQLHPGVVGRPGWSDPDRSRGTRRVEAVRRPAARHGHKRAIRSSRVLAPCHCSRSAMPR